MHDKVINDAGMIHSWLCDEQSKSIFLNRLSWLISGDDKWLDKFKNTNSDTTYPRICKKGEEDLIKKALELSRPVIIYGGGGIGTGVYKTLNDAKIPIKCFWDKDEKKQKSGVCGALTQAPGADYNGETIIVATGWYMDEVIKSIHSFDISDENIIIPDFAEVSLDIKNSYFDPDIIKFGDHEVFVDGGCFDFGTCQMLLSKCNTVKSIYTFDPDENQWISIQDGINKSGFHNTRFIKKGLWSETTTLRFTQTFGGGSSIEEEGTVIVPVTSIDDAVHEPVSFIKMDIEGAELEALQGAAKHIVNDKPKLAICVYHKPEDIFEIPIYIKSLVPEYRLFMRHYSNADVETVLYAVI